MANTVRDAVANREEAQPPDNTGGVLALREDQGWWEPKQLAALKSLGIKHATKEDLLVYFHYCQKTRLDPFSKQIYLLERRSKNRDTGQWEYTQTIQVGIDGFRVNAHRAARNQGVRIEYEDTIWFDARGDKHEVWLDRETPPSAAKVTVIKHYTDGTTARFPGIAVFESYADYGKDKDGNKYLKAQWGVMPDHMIEKCAEAFALRRAFPNDLGGLYIEEELQHDYQPPGAPPKLRAHRREPDAEDDNVMDGEVISETEEPADTVPDPRESLDGIATVMREHGIGAKNLARTRLAVVTGLYHQMMGTEVTGYLTPENMQPEQLHELSQVVAQFCNGLTDTPEANVKEQLIAYGDAISNSLNLKEAQEA